MRTKLKVAMLGTGDLNYVIARRLLEDHVELYIRHEVTRPVAQELIESGVHVREDLLELVEECDVVVTTASDHKQLDYLMLEHDEVLSSMSVGCAWIHFGMVDYADTIRMAAHADEHGIVFLDASLLGSYEAILAGEATVLVAGVPIGLVACHEIFETLGQTVLEFQQMGDTSRIKQVFSFWNGGLLGLIAHTSELARSLSLSPRDFFSIVARNSIATPHLDRLDGELDGGTEMLSVMLSEIEHLSTVIIDPNHMGDGADEGRELVDHMVDYLKRVRSEVGHAPVARTLLPDGSTKG